MGRGRLRGTTTITLLLSSGSGPWSLARWVLERLRLLLLGRLSTSILARGCRGGSLMMAPVPATVAMAVMMVLILASRGHELRCRLSWLSLAASRLILALLLLIGGVTVVVVARWGRLLAGGD